ncbi:MAG: PEP-CTERM sorting domain-containing protein [Sphingomonadaceae bacterium]|jgi:hypothetical protein|nr:PEP-CTERM sorting domain-containing protein [Sphingomonadaceae bacterium]MCP5383299.1 PEP-CTERM sorting domain-containing protein [Altererythrobacter sp.]MCP5393476.1 PEP-CTERM sorting domain-containing protein [Sphingomonadaceae bacterium]
MRTLIILAYAILAAEPVFAQGGASVPEPSNMALFALGVLGLIVGRQFSKHRRNSDD